MDNLYPQVRQFISSIDTTSISEHRKARLSSIITHLKKKIILTADIHLIFICTHNSRRSHFAQIWAQTLAAYFHLEKIKAYSGGTEITALYPTVLKSLEKIGFKSTLLSSGTNPVYAIKYGENALSIIGFSKEWNHQFNPQSEFTTIMTCAQADASCPHIAGAEARFSLPFQDPKAYDNSQQESQEYLNTCKLIATEMYYIFSQI